ncbi:MAG TPA: hypothetical protein VG712_03335, partial [Gemmatimonadales bacterium]|nr:hypothetical protein [Gemmatimonadales bacterium]
PGGASVIIPGGQTYVVNTLVLGTGADLDIGSSGSLTVNGNVYAGQTITGSGSLIVAGGASQLSGTFPTLTITGSATAVGPTTITGDLIIDGTGDGAEFNVGGAKVDVAGTLFTQTGGLLTMDGNTDTLLVGSASFAGGNEFGHLTDGVLVVRGSNFDQGFGDNASFMATANHTTVFNNTGGSTAINITHPANSQFASVEVLSPNGVDFNESGLGRVRMVGNLTLGSNAVVTGDTLEVFGTFTAGAVSDLTLNVLTLVNTPVLSGTYNVTTTQFSGPAISIPAAPILYERLLVDGTATLASDVTARTVLITGSGLVDVNGYNFLADSLYTTASGALVMDAAEDTVLVADTAAFFGGDESTLLTDGVLRLGGSFNATGDHFTSTGNHLTEFFTAIPKVMKISPDGYCEGSCPYSQRVQFAHLKIDATNVSIDDPVEAGLFAGDLAMTGANVTGPYVDLQVAGDIHADATSALTLRKLMIAGTVDVQIPDGSFSVATVQFQGNGQLLPDLNYNQLLITGALVTLADTIDAASVIVAN